MFSSFSKIDALAVRYVNDVVCIGLGSVLHTLNKSNHKLLFKLDVLYPERIHAIIQAPDNKLIIYGGKSLRICKLDNKLENISDIYRFTDWIIAAGCAVIEKEVKLIILFAHNNLYICDLLNKQHETIWCQEKCILYGGSIYNKNSGDVVVFSGTVFQEILVWKTKITGSNEDAPILHRLKGHNGVIFSVFYDPFTNLICSTSDDRTVRLWGMQYEKEKIPENSLVKWEQVEISLRATMYGHTARVWRAMIKNDTVVSIGEDSQICLWSTTGQFLKKIHAHHGAAIWSVDVSKTDNRMLTGAADGSIYAWPFPFTHEPENSTILENPDKKNPKFACCLKSGTILVIKEGGEINCFDPVSHNLSGSHKLPKFSDYLLMQVSPDRRRISLASKDGFVTIYQEIISEKGSELMWQVTEKILDSKIFSIQWLDNDAILICGSLGRLNIASVGSDGEIKLISDYILPESRERWITAAIIYESLLICGDRAGSVFVFKSLQKPVQTFYKIHGKFGIQSCRIRAGKLITAGRDGQLRFFQLRNENGEYFLDFESAKNMPMDWINRVVETEEDQYVFGFSEIDFVVYSISLRRILIRIPCGGGHRSWDCVIKKNILKFVFIRDKHVHLIKFLLHKLALPPLVEGFHLKEIYSLQSLKNFKNSCIFISGSEDCSLRISEAVKSKTRGIEDFKTLEILDGHISNVKCLAILNLENTEFFCKNLLFTGGGRAQLKVWELILKLEKNFLKSEDLSCKNLDSFMLRGTDKERKKIIKALKMNYDVDPETRFMDINVYVNPESSDLIFLFVACSDGFLRIFSFNRDDLKLKIENTIEYSRCILKVHSFTHEDNLIVLTMATDGIINFWNFSFIKNQEKEKELPKPFTKIHIHQSGINSFDLEKVDGNYLLVSGGDDNLLSLIVFNLILLENGNLSAQIVNKWNSSTCHCAQITGVKFCEGKLYSTSTDQKVIVHKYFYKNMELSVIKENEIITCVSDVQGITLCASDELGDTLICTYGKGIEFLVDKK
ncbi:WD repeat-containing protein 6 [Belonocnema kinseyi]|uniref:WD repeat-containing protein 6 n=1 Tax=Belonocnema kinseyi TaxID=2817044 RepID=UPI00143DB429|nr:WD repeat-containing protein 6 [Belonocnema kinseyi]